MTRWWSRPCACRSRKRSARARARHRGRSRPGCGIPAASPLSHPNEPVYALAAFGYARLTSLLSTTPKPTLEPSRANRGLQCSRSRLARSSPPSSKIAQPHNVRPRKNRLEVRPGRVESRSGLKSVPQVPNPSAKPRERAALRPQLAPDEPHLLP